MLAKFCRPAGARGEELKMALLRGEIRRMAGEVMICGFEGVQIEAETREILREIKPLGLIAFARNVEGPEGLCELNHELKGLPRADPLLLSVDQEGGRVARIREGVSVWPPMAALGRLDDPQLAYAVGQALAREVRALGFDMNYAPVLDVDTNPKNPVIGDRALAKTPAAVARLGAAMVRGLQEAGVAACGKHFPGHGDTEVDSHLALPSIEHELPRLQQVEWPPFAAAIAADVAAIMTAHVHVPVLDTLPATLSKKTLRHHLRGQLGFAGAIISDDIDMRGLSDHHAAEVVGAQGLAAGVDVFLACKDPAAMFALFRGIVLAAEDKTLDHDVLEAAAKRARALRGRYVAATVVPKVALGRLQELRDRHRPLVDRLMAATS